MRPCRVQKKINNGTMGWDHCCTSSPPARTTDQNSRKENAGGRNWPHHINAFPAKICRGPRWIVVPLSSSVCTPMPAVRCHFCSFVSRHVRHVYDDGMYVLCSGVSVGVRLVCLELDVRNGGHGDVFRWNGHHVHCSGYAVTFLVLCRFICFRDVPVFVSIFAPLFTKKRYSICHTTTQAAQGFY